MSNLWFRRIVSESISTTDGKHWTVMHTVTTTIVTEMASVLLIG